MMHWSVSWLIGIIILGFQGEGELKPCPDSPNCVNTYQSDEEHEPMTPLAFEGDVYQAMDTLVSLVDNMSRTELIEHEGVYAHFTFKIAVFGFIDDVEFHADTVNNVIHFRSASRKGYYDLGVNNRRMEEIQEIWEENK